MTSPLSFAFLQQVQSRPFVNMITPDATPDNTTQEGGWRWSGGAALHIDLLGAGMLLLAGDLQAFQIQDDDDGQGG